MAKVSILTMIRNKKDILFGKFSDSITAHDKEREWKTITESAHALGILQLNKSWKDLRDTTYTNWRRATVTKRDKKNKTGGKGGASILFSDTDLIILDIIGPDSPGLVGISGVPQSSGSDSVVPVRPTVYFDDQSSNLSELDVNAGDNLTTPATGSAPIQQTRSRRGRSNKRTRLASLIDCEDVEELKCSKIKLQIEALKLDNKKKMLDIISTEKLIGLPHSKDSIKFLADEYDVEVSSSTNENVEEEINSS